jgi:hypothetical protein
MKVKSGQPFTKLVQDTLVASGVAIPDNIFSAIDTMRERLRDTKP